MPKIIICEKAENLSSLTSDSIAIIPRNSLSALLSQEKVERIQDILDAFFDRRDAVPPVDIENHQITKSLRAVNKKIKVFNDKIIDVDVLQSLLKEGIIPVLIV